MKKFLSTVLAVSVVASTVAALGLTANAYSQYGTNGNVRRVGIKSTYYTEEEDSKRYTEYKYDESGNNIEDINYGFDEDDKKVPNDKQVNTFDANGNRVKAEFFNYDSEKDTWKKTEDIIETYDANGNMLTSKTYDYDDEGESGLYNESVCTYNDKNLIVYEKNIVYKDPTLIDTIYEYNFEYDADGRLTTSENICKDKNNVVENATLEEFTYEGTNEDYSTVIVKTANGTDPYALSSKREFTYDENNRAIGEKTYAYVSQDWVLTSERHKSYTVDGNVTTIIVTKVDLDTKAETNYDKTVCTYDNFGNYTQIERYDWNTQNSEWTKIILYEYEYETIADRIVSGANQVVDVNTVKEATFRSDADFKYFVKVTVDGNDVDAKYYTVKEGSTIVTLNQSFIETLSNGEHKLSIVSKYSSADTTFTVSGVKKVSPATGDTMEIALFSAILVASAVACAVVLRKKEN